MPRYKFKWSNLPPSLLEALARDLLGPYNSDESAAALRAAYGARPTTEFIRETWPTLLESWLRTDNESRELIVQALEDARGEKGLVKGSRAQMTYLRELRNSKNLREIVWDELVAAGELERESEQDPDEEAGDSAPSHAERPETRRLFVNRRLSNSGSGSGSGSGISRLLES